MLPSFLTDAAGPIDWLVIATVFGLGLVSATILSYTIGGWYSQRLSN